MNTRSPSPSPDDSPAGLPTPSDRRQRLETFAISCLLAICLGFPLLRTSGWYQFETALDADFASGSALMQLVFGSVFAIAGLLVLRHSGTLWPIVRRINPFLLLLVAWASLTILWSPEPVTTLKRSVQLIGLVLVGLTLCLPWLSPRLFTTVMFRTLTTVVLVSGVVSLLLPGIGVDYIRDNAWRGLTWHKNTLGNAAAVAFLLWVVAINSRRLDWRLGFFGLFLVFVVLVFAKSSTALMTAMIAVATYVFTRRRYFEDANLASVVALSLVALVTAVLMIFFAVMGRLPTWAEVIWPITAMLDRDPDLTGRTELWQLTLLEAMRHPIQGLGFGAFWLNVGSRSQFIIEILGWVPLQAHNAYIDIFNELGAVGFSLFVGMVIWHMVALRRVGRYDPELAALHWALLIMILVSNMSESLIFNGLAFQSNLFLLSSILIAGAAARLPQRAGGQKSSSSMALAS